MRKVKHLQIKKGNSQVSVAKLHFIYKLLMSLLISRVLALRGFLSAFREDEWHLMPAAGLW